MKKLLYILIFLFLSFSFDAVPPPPSGWYQQFTNLPSGTNIVDMLFLDSLTGFLVTGGSIPPKIFKTTNGGDNWFLNYEIYRGLYQIQFINDSIGFIAGNRVLVKTTNRGISWDTISAPEGTANGLYALNEDTIYIVGDAQLVGGIFRSTNGGLNWTRLTPDVGPIEIYMLDFNTGFYADNTWMRKTTNGGANWHIVSVTFNDIYFINNNTGWHCEDVSDLYKTTNAGENWEILPLPPSNDSIITSKLNDFSVINEDTIWGTGPIIFFGAGQFRGLIYITTDGGNAWGYQLPDTSIHIPDYFYVRFTDKNHGWVYRQNRGVHTISGGNDTTLYLEMKPISTEIPGGYRLHQNYPNPFNYSTRIKFDISKTSYVTLKVYNLLGKEIDEIVNSKISAGSYDFKFIGSELTSGVYFYSLSADGNVVDTKKMVLVK